MIFKFGVSRVVSSDRDQVLGRIAFKEVNIG